VILSNVTYGLIENLRFALAWIVLFEIDNDFNIVWILIHAESNSEWFADDFEFKREGTLHKLDIIQINWLQDIDFFFLWLNIRQLLLVQLLDCFHCHFANKNWMIYSFQAYYCFFFKERIKMKINQLNER